MRRSLALIVTLIAAAPDAWAHPHVWIDAKAEIVYDGQKRLAAIRHAWTFDEAFSAFAIQGLDADGDGKLSREELQPLAEVNVTSLAEFGYFTSLKAKNGTEARDALLRGVLPGSTARKGVEFTAPAEYWLALDAGRLTLHYSLPLKRPLAHGHDPVTLEIHDPSYFVSFTLAKEEPVRLAGAGAGCRLDLERPRELNTSAATAFAQIPADTRSLPQELQDLAAGLANRIVITCG